jgi:4-amino-4-deoxy-L-arabinose transferase-like glycosyltransferase
LQYGATDVESNKSNQINSASDRFPKILPIVLILLYFSLAVVKIRYPGVQYDELLWGNAALGGVDWTFITYKIGELPVLLMPYIGAVKAYIYYPIFKLFGVSPWSIRVPAIIMTAGALSLLFHAARRYFDNKTALLALFLLSIDPSFISQTRVDCGPIVLEFCCKVVALYLLIILLDNLRFRYVLGIYLVLAIGLFNKLNFMWFVNSLVFSASVIFYRDFKGSLEGRPVKQKYLFVLSNVAGYAVLVGYYLFISRTYGLTDELNLFVSLDRLAEIFASLKVLITGESFYVYALGDINSPLTGYYFFFILLLFVLGFIIIAFKRTGLEQRHRKNYYFFLLIFLTSLYQICITKQAGANWHLFSVYPSITLLLAATIVTVARHLFARGAASDAAVTVLVIIIAGYCTAINVRYINAYGLPTKNVGWSNAIYELIEYTEKSTYKFASVDWGTHAQLITFDPVASKYREICYGLGTDDPGEAQSILDTLLEPGNSFAFIMHPVEETSVMNPRLGIFDAAERSGKRLKLIKTITDGGRPIFEIYLPERKS